MTLDNNISFFYVLILIIVILSITFILYIEPKLNTKKIKNHNEHGSSKFASPKEIHKNFKKENLYNITEAGFPIYFDKSKNKFSNVYFDNTSPHWVLIGSTGSGKSTCVVIPECLMFATSKKKHSIIVTDPKGEIFAKTSKLFKNNGYKHIFTIDFRNPNLSNRINIMQPIVDEWKIHCFYDEKLFLCICLLYNKLNIDYEKFIIDESYRFYIKTNNKLDNYIIDYILNKIDIINEKIENEDFYNTLKNKLDFDYNNISIKDLLLLIKDYQNKSSSSQAESIRLTNTLADLIFSEKETKDPFWLNSSKNLFKGICGIFLEDYQNGLIPENKINISSIKKFQNSSLIKENQLYLQRNLNSREYGTMSKDYLTSILSANENTYKSITAVFGEKMQIFDDLNVENITSTSDFDFSTLVNDPSVLYIIVPDEDKSYYQLVTIIVGMIYKDLTKLANMPQNNGILPRKLEWILDEFANCPPLAEIETIVSVARSRGMRFQFFIQSFAQLESVYTKEISNIILDNSALCYLKTNSVECAEIISKKLGRATIETTSISQSTDQFKIGGNKTTSLLGRELLTPNEIISLKYKTIIFPTISNAIFRDTYLYTDLFKGYNFTPVERESKILKKSTQNYYTVEQMKANYETPVKNYEDDSINNNETVENKIDNNLKYTINNIEKLFNVKSFNNKIIINRKISKYEENKIIDLISPMINIEVITDEESNSTIITFFNAEKYRYYL